MTRCFVPAIAIERWERPLSELAAQAGPQTVVIFAQPFTRETDDIRAVRTILERGGRVLSTGFWGGYLLPGESADTPREFTFAACRLEPEGLDPLASSGEVWMIPGATWQVGKPTDRVQYSCAGQPAVVEYGWGKGTCGVVGQFHSARKWLPGQGAQPGVTAEFAGATRGTPVLLG